MPATTPRYRVEIQDEDGSWDIYKNSTAYTYGSAAATARCFVRSFDKPVRVFDTHKGATVWPKAP